MREKMKNSKYYGILLWFLYFAFYIPFVNKGIDVTDTSFYLIKYKYLFDINSGIQEFGTILTNIIGGVLYKLLPGYQLFSYNVLGILAYCICGVLTWKVLKAYKKDNIVYLGIFASNLLAISFIKTLNYNILSALFFHCGIYMLLKGLFEEKKGYLFFSGIVLALNIYIRFPNVLHLAVGSIFIFRGIQEGNWKNRIKELMIWCFGCAVGVGLGLTLSLCFLEPTLILNTLNDYFNKAGSSADVRGISYGIKFMLQCMKSGWKYNLLYLAPLIVTFFALSKCTRRKDIVSKLGIAFSVVSGVLFQLNITYRQHSLSLIYFIIYIVLFMGMLSFIRRDKKFSVLCCVSLIISLVGVFGSDTYIQVLSFFSYFPICISCLVIMKMTEVEKLKSYKIVANMIVAFLISTSLFGGGKMLITEVYRDAPYKNLTEEMSSEFGPYGGMKTSEKHKKAIESTKNVLEHFPGEQLLFLGDFNAGCVVSDTNSFFSVPWPDLASFTVESFNRELEDKTKQGIYPVILLADKEKFSRRDISEKAAIVKEYIAREQYEIYYSDEYITVYAKN